MIDSGGQPFSGGELYFRQIDDLAMNICVAKKIDNDGWQEYLDATLALAKKLGRAPNASMISCLHEYPNAKQRQMAAEFMLRNNVRPMDRVAVLTDNALLRGAMLAFSWIMPNVGTHAFASKDLASASEWLWQGA